MGWVEEAEIIKVAIKYGTPPVGNLQRERYIYIYRVFIKYCVFSLKFCVFSELCLFCCSAGFLPAWYVCTHTDTEGKQSSEYFEKFGKKTQYLMNTLYVPQLSCVDISPLISFMLWLKGRFFLSRKNDNYIDNNAYTGVTVQFVFSLDLQLQGCSKQYMAKPKSKINKSKQ